MATLFFEELERFCSLAELAGRSDARRMLRFYEQWLRSTRGDNLYISKAAAKDYVKHLKVQEWSPRSAALHLKIVSDFYLWLHHGVETLNPFRGTSVPKSMKPPKGPTPLTQRQIDILTKNIRRTNEDPFNYYKMSLLFSVATYMGLSNQEICALDVDTLRDPSGLASIGNKEVPVSPAIRQALRQWIQYRAAKAPYDEPALFIGLSGKRLRPGTVENYFVHLGQASRVPCSSKKLRDTFAYNLAADGATVNVIMQLRGIKEFQAKAFIELANQGRSADDLYMRSVQSRMKPVRRYKR